MNNFNFLAVIFKVIEVARRRSMGQKLEIWVSFCFKHQSIAIFKFFGINFLYFWQNPFLPSFLDSSQLILYKLKFKVENQAPIKMTDELKSVLEQDYYKVCRKKVLTHLPAPINVASVLEDYVRHYAATCLVNYEKQISKSYYTVNRKETSR